MNLIYPNMGFSSVETLLLGVREVVSSNLSGDIELSFNKILLEVFYIIINIFIAKYFELCIEYILIKSK